MCSQSLSHKIRAIEIITLEQAQIMREIYNENIADLSTKPLKEITLEEQKKWWERSNKPEKSWLIFDHNTYELLGFVMLTDRGNFKTPLFAIQKKYHGKGWGEFFIKFYLSMTSKILAGSQLQSNKAICHLNKKLGWRILGEKNGIDYLFHPITFRYDCLNCFDYLMDAEEEVRRYHEL